MRPLRKYELAAQETIAFSYHMGPMRIIRLSLYGPHEGRPYGPHAVLAGVSAWASYWWAHLEPHGLHAGIALEPYGSVHMCTTWSPDGDQMGLHICAPHRHRWSQKGLSTCVYYMGIMWAPSGFDKVCQMGPWCVTCVLYRGSTPGVQHGSQVGPTCAV